MQGSAPGLPLPTNPGHMALWSFGKLFFTELFVFTMAFPVSHRVKRGKNYKKGERRKTFFTRSDT
jgi:hypothetical protein